MKKLIMGILALFTAIAFAGGSLVFAGEATPAQRHAQAQQIAPEKATKEEHAKKGVQTKSAKKKAKKKAAKQPRKSQQPVE